MTTLESVLSERGYKVANIDYPSREKPIEELSPLAIEAGLQALGPDRNDRIHLVTHSMGGIRIRYYLKHNELGNLGHVVMIAPPDQGSKVVDNLANVPGFSLVNGPAGLQLGTDKNSISSKLEPVGFSVGIIAGTTTFNPVLSQFLPNPDDGKISGEGTADFREVAASHPFIMNDDTVLNHAIAFIETGASAENEP